MKLLLNTILNLLKWIFITLIILFSIATFMGKSFLQTGILWLLVVILIWWPKVFVNRWNKAVSNTIRLALIVVLILISFVGFKPDPKKSIYLSDQLEEELMKIYDEKTAYWPEHTEDLYIDSKYGRVHVLACGNKENPPLIMVHAASMGAHSWAENLEPLLDRFRIYSVDNIGEGNKSVLKDALVYPDNQKEIADHFAFLMDHLGLESAPLFGASNGGFVIQCFASYYPERVASLALFGPMGLTQLTGNSVMMLSIATMYPFQFVRDRVTRWAIGEDPYVNEKYGDWFNCMMKATIPSVARPVPLTTEQKSSIDLPVLLFLGTKDQIVGDPETAKNLANDFPDIRIQILESGHLIAVEHADYVNKVIEEFLGL